MVQNIYINIYIYACEILVYSSVYPSVCSSVFKCVYKCVLNDVFAYEIISIRICSCPVSTCVSTHISTHVSTHVSTLFLARFWVELMQNTPWLVEVIQRCPGSVSEVMNLVGKHTSDEKCCCCETDSGTATSEETGCCADQNSDPETACTCVSEVMETAEKHTVGRG